MIRFFCEDGRSRWFPDTFQFKLLRCGAVQILPAREIRVGDCGAWTPDAGECAKIVVITKIERRPA